MLHYAESLQVLHAQDGSLDHVEHDATTNSQALTPSCVGQCLAVRLRAALGWFLLFMLVSSFYLPRLWNIHMRLLCVLVT